MVRLGSRRGCGRGVSVRLIAGLALAALATAVAAQSPVGSRPTSLPPEAHGRLPYIAYAQISPDGRRVAFVRQFGGIRDLSIIEPGKSQLSSFQKTLGPVMEWAPPVKPESLVWVSDESLVIEHTVTLPPRKGDKDGEPLDFSGILFFQRLEGRGVNVRRDDLWGDLVGLGTGEGRLLVGRFEKNTQFLAEFDGATLKDTRRLDSLPASKRGAKRVAGWIPSPDGRVRTRLVVTLPPTPAFSIEVRATDATDSPWSVVQVMSGDAPDFRPLGFGADPARLLGLKIGPGRRSVVASMDLATGVTGAPLFAAPDVDVDGAVQDLYSDQLVGFRFADEFERIHWLDEGLQQLEERAKASFPGERVTLDSWSRDRKSLLVLVQGPRNPGAYWVLRPDSGERLLVGVLYPAVPDDSVAQVQRFSYVTRDGKEIRGYLTLPPGRDTSSLPLIIMPHGGPAARDLDGFDWWAQALAARGYAVLQPNFRGSGGFGLDFEEAGYRQWGQRMQDDLTDGVAAVIAKGIADPTRVCIVGASYGGYAALAGVTLTPDLYRCAASVAGVSDLPAMIEFSRGGRRGGDSFALRYWSKAIGDPVTDRGMLRRVSPRFQAAAVKAPVLLIHGKSDTVVPVIQSLMMRDALTAAGKPVTLVELDGEDHFLRREKTRTEMLRVLFEFLDRNNPAGALPSR